MKPGITPPMHTHDRQDFDCRACAQHAAQSWPDSSRRDFNRTYVAAFPGQSRIHGFMHCAASIHFENLPQTRNLPRYPVPVARIGRLAVDLRSQGMGVGLMLLQHAMNLAESLSQQIGLYALFVEAKHETAGAFYARYGFERLPDHPLNLFLTIDLIRRARAASVAH
ncbi:MAG: GNAT family N-acetyltransferase [Rhodoferax sp.]|nr:GNAT family N-acetyltransferase [Rhodoferax sp.]